MGRLSRRKGAAFERSMVHRFRAELPGLPIRRGAQARGGSEAPDVDVPGLWVECKHGLKVNHRAALAQAIRDAAGTRMPVAVCKDDRSEPIVLMRLDDFLALWRASWNRGGVA
jgi:hypothetical protein